VREGKMLLKKICVFLVVSMMVSGCQDGAMSKQGVGTGLGAVAGGLLGSTVGKGNGRTAAILLGAVGGAFAGNAIGASLDRADRAYYNNTTTSSLESVPSGQTSTWKNPDSGNWGSFTPTKTYQGSSGQYCREFSQKIVVGGQVQEGYGTACRGPDGAWKVVQ